MAAIQLGLQYGYPLCCIRFFVTVWHDWIHAEMTGQSDDARAYRYLTHASPVNYHYVPCPRCLAANHIAIPAPP